MGCPIIVNPDFLKPGEGVWWKEMEDMLNSLMSQRKQTLDKRDQTCTTSVQSYKHGARATQNLLGEMLTR